MSAKPTPARPRRELLDPQLAGELLGMSPKSVANYADTGRLWSTRTIGGHRRYDRADVERLAHELEADR